ncbi:hypothetical protein CJF31_00000827 [Rutstroemia sp. NJR-2017a BVV2]|nr:hypothetical protein CJF31_00000827 [Rutstroemia sp. NJR-2017a BVV2]
MKSSNATPKPKSSNLRLLPCDPLIDGPEILSQQIAAFSNPVEPFFFVLYPPTEKFENAVKRTVDRWLADAGAKYVKVVDERGNLISAAKWLINTAPLTEEQKQEYISVDWHDDADSNEWAAYLINWVHQHQLKYTKGEPCVVLDILTTHPSHQRLGAGTLLMEYGTAIADELGLPGFIDGTIIAKHLYESHGFKPINGGRYIEIPVPEKWRNREDRPVSRFLFYIREVKGR